MRLILILALLGLAGCARHIYTYNLVVYDDQKSSKTYKLVTQCRHEPSLKLKKGEMFFNGKKVCKKATGFRVLSQHKQRRIQ